MAIKAGRTPRPKNPEAADAYVAGSADTVTSVPYQHTVNQPAPTRTPLTFAVEPLTSAVRFDDLKRQDRTERRTFNTTIDADLLNHLAGLSRLTNIPMNELVEQLIKSPLDAAVNDARIRFNLTDEAWNLFVQNSRRLK